jgi:hypothetical protein
MTDNSLRSDYFFLEEVLNHMPKACKIAKMEDGEFSSGSNKHKATNKKSQRLVQQAERRGITLQTLPSFMERHKNNSSWYCGPRDMITWKVEIIIIPTNQTLSFNLSENEDDILVHIRKHILQKTNNSHAEGAENDFKLMLKRPSPANKPRYLQLNPNECLRKALEGLTIIEYPTIYCVQNDSIFLEQFPTGTNILVEQKSEE